MNKSTGNGETHGASLAEFADLLLKGDLFQDLSPADAEHILAQTRRRRVAVGESVCRQGEHGDSMYIVVDGRFRVSARRGGQPEIVLNHLGRGHHFGELSMLVGTPRTATVTATMESELLELGRSEFHSLIRSIPGFGANLSRSLGYWLQRESEGGRARLRPSVVAMIYQSPLTASIAPQVVQALCEKGSSVYLLTDRADQFSPNACLTVDATPADEWSQVSERVRRALGAGVAAGRRVLIDLSAQTLQSRMELLSQCEQIWWIDEPLDYDQSRGLVEQLLSRNPTLASRFRFVWVLKQVYPLAPAVQHGVETGAKDLRVACDPSKPSQLRAADLSRLVHRIEGICLGLVLGGGGARGLAHIGALRAFENAGIYFDQMAGTSIGALVGAMYAAGYDPDKILEIVGSAMTPPRWMRYVPGGRRWFLIATFRLGWAEQIIRQQYEQCSFEQLLIPFHTVSVDLVTGQKVVRETGDAVGAILESFNIPGLAAPILRDGQALVDGGVLDNLPAGLLRERGSDYVVAVDVTVKLAERFGGNNPDTPLPKMKRPGITETLLRVLEVQQRGLGWVQSMAVDFAVQPDISVFDFDDFTRGGEMADAGQAATEARIPRLKQILAELEAAEIDR